MCGIFGQINKKQGKFNFPAFATLGIANDSRGGDSCGIFIDKKTEYGIDKTKLFANFLDSSKLLHNTINCHIALGHCRKASVGVIDLERAQPVVIKENNEVKFVVIHNGTINNYKNLAQKYIPQINIDGMTDSQVMAHIFYHVGYDCLEEYTGGAVFVIVDYRPQEPTIYFFKGKSKYNSCSTVATDERPFYFVTVNKTLLFSSIYTWLRPFAQGNEIYTIDTNALIQVQNLDLTIVQKFNRENNLQTQPVATTSGYCYPHYTGYNCYAYNESYKTSSKIVMNANGLFTERDTFVHGMRNVEPDGTVKWSTNSRMLYFWHGILLKNQHCYDFLNNFVTKANIKSQDLITYIPKTLHKLSFYPIFTHTLNPLEISQDIAPTDLVYFDGTTYKPYTGTLHFLGEDGVACIVDGFYTDYLMNDDGVTFVSNWSQNITTMLNTSELYDLIAKECNTVIKDN